ncbi:Mediator of replication checkpoint protein 1 [Wickerhamomyces ciferrii]|uniref:Mediator of replication checkpoint protein 1 n=1 Tax=Wickerhamomyces ciferrii (strain ATCC 14091 / BCRC 22168 / CBS 111 / JCM 3599 / NBRC 0793 / NRRL Y-1031 F-60-10) TaxID=1206466 RepID=K0KLE2_WICCF|nr:Mediator of replication checkpoint protein 1 [Wickerhamomyces ciferrii]CCH43781.1 Mediator of replication checkpoint protein 1 [Wickerhamomyces ciferrii]
MDLLDDLELSPVKSKTFKKNIDLKVDNDVENSDEESNELPTSTPVLNDISNNKPDTEASKPKGVPSIANLFGSSVSLLDRVKKRLNGEKLDEPVPESEKPTQEIQTQLIDKTQETTTSNTTSEENQSTQEIEPPTQQINNSHIQESTQVIPTSESQNQDSILSTSKMDQTQNVDDIPSSQITKSSTKSPSYEISKDDINDVFAEEQDTQVVLNQQTAPVNDQHDDDEDDEDEIRQPTRSIPNMFSDDDEEEEDLHTKTQEKKKNNSLFMDSESEDDEDNKLNVKEEAHKEEDLDPTQARLKKIEQLAAKKRAERLLREQQEREKDQNDLTTYKQLSDPVKGEYDDDDENEGDVSVSTIKPKRTKTKKELEEEEQERRRQARSEQLQHEEKVVKKFDKNSLLAAFGMGDNVPSDNMSSPQKHQSSPATSPLQEEENGKGPIVKTEKSGNVELSDESDDDDDFQVTDFFNEDKMKKMEEKEKPKFVLQTPFNFNKQATEVIELDSDSDSDIEEATSKVTRLEVKSKFSKQTMGKQAQKKKQVSRNQLIAHLREKARNQLKKDKTDFEEANKEIIAEVAQEQDAVDKLLDKFMAAADRQKEKEKMIKEQRKRAKEAGVEFNDNAYDDESDYAEVPDSDFDQSMDENESEGDEDAGDEEGSDEDNEADEEQKDNNEEEEEADGGDDKDREATEAEIKQHLLAKKQNDSAEATINWGDDSQDFGDLEGLNGGATQKLKMLGMGLTQAFETESPKIDGKTVNIFDQIRNKNNHVIGEEDSFVESSLKDKSFSYSINSQKPRELNFDEPATQLSEIMPPTQAISTQKDSIGTLHDSAPQDSFQATVKDDYGDFADAEDDEDDEDELPVKRHRIKRVVKDDTKESDVEDEKEQDAFNEEEEDDDDEEEEETEEERRKRADAIRAEIRRREKEQEDRRLEMKKQGLDKIMENEAEESEDEWQGIGGIDGEKFDEENSEDEKMLDDYSKVNLNKEELDKFIAEQENIKDKKLLTKVLKDVDEHFKSKKGDRSLDIEVDGDDDEVIQRYNRLRNEKMRQRLLENMEVAKLSKDAKAKAFFQSIAEDSQNPINEIFGGNETDSDAQSDLDNEEDDPFVEKQEITKDQMQDPDNAPKKKKTIKITEAYVQKTLSFLNDDEDDKIEQNAAFAAHQHGFLDDDDDFGDDLHSLKQKSIIRMPETTPQRKSTIDLTNEEDQSPTQFFKMPSKIMKSFQSNSNDSFKNKNEVTVSTAYKAATSSKASIMSFGKTKNTETKQPSKRVSQSQDTRVLKARKIERTLKKGNKLKKLNTEAFE